MRSAGGGSDIAGQSVPGVPGEQGEGNRGELHQVLDGLADAIPPRGLTVALRETTAVWLISCVVQFVVWLSLAFFGHFDWPWWLYSDLGLGAVVGILWWTHETYHRKSAVLLNR